MEKKNISAQNTKRTAAAICHIFRQVLKKLRGIPETDMCRRAFVRSILQPENKVLRDPKACWENKPLSFNLIIREYVLKEHYIKYSTSQESASRIYYGEFLLIISAYFYICLYDSARSSTSINDILLYYELFINRNGSDGGHQSTANGEKWHFCAGARLNSLILLKFLEPF